MFLQTLVAVREVTKEVMNRREDFFPIQPLDCAKLLVISLGTGSVKHEDIYTAEMASEWGLMSWLFSRNSIPIIDIYNQASTDMVDYFLSLIFQTQTSQQNYLRIQVNIFKLKFWIYHYLQIYYIMSYRPLNDVFNPY